ncbi:hypothetical protein PIB30_063034, partial [Stylosanthes scabra]|nr:hypothetical protein [Stylosanthes scabra]
MNLNSYLDTNSTLTRDFLRVNEHPSTQIHHNNSQLMCCEYYAQKQARSSAKPQNSKKFQESKRTERASHSRKRCVNRSSGVKVMAAGIGGWCLMRVPLVNGGSVISRFGPVRAKLLAKV